MFKKITSLLLVGLLLTTLGPSPASAETKEEKESRFAQRVKEGIAKLGTGQEARVEIKLKDKRKLKGYIGQINAETFSVVDETGTVTEVPYPQVKQVKGNNLSEGVKIAIFVGVLIAGLVAIAYLSSGN
jgi:hypothetical protein